MDAGCHRHGCWYAQQGYKDCFDSSDGCCILGCAVSAPKLPQFEGTDLSGHAVIAGGTITADRLEFDEVTTEVFPGVYDDGRVEFGGSWFESGRPWLPWPLYALHPGSVASGRQFDLAFLPRPGRGIVYREHECSPADAPHPAREHPDPEEGDVWHVAGERGAVRDWLFYAGAWREVAGLQVDIALERAAAFDGLVVPRPSSTVQMRGTWK